MSDFGSLVGGVLCLDFANTVRARVSNPAHGRDYADTILDERLTSHDDLVRWAELAAIITAAQAKRLIAEARAHPARAATVLRRALKVREAIYRLFRGAIAGWPPRPDDLTALDRELQIARAHEHLTATPSGIALTSATTALDAPLWPVVRSAADLLTGPRLARVGQCPGDECNWLFLDTSRSGRRHWCDMRDCGNVAKVRRFRNRTS